MSSLQVIGDASLDRALDKAEERLGSFEGVNFTPALRAALKVTNAQWLRNLPPQYASNKWPPYRQGIAGRPKAGIRPIREGVAITAKKINATTWFAVAGIDSAKTENWRVAWLIDEGHEIVIPRRQRGKKAVYKMVNTGKKSRAYRTRDNAIETTRSARDAAFEAKMDKIVDKILGF